jgi:diketogulonate reductase-like aldo/keto reductase
MKTQQQETPVFAMPVSAIPHVTANGASIPAIGLGTWPLKGAECEAAIAAALGCGYRHIDTAAMYGNEAEVGRALKASTVARQDIWVTTKVWADDIGAGNLQRSAENSLRALQLDHVDLLLIHWPNPNIPLKDSIAALCDAKRRGLTKHIGVSNFPTALMREAAKLTSEPIVTNQIEYHPHLDQRKVLAEAKALGWSVTSYCPLGRGSVGGVLSEPAVTAIAKRHGKTPAQVVLRWHLQQPSVIAVPKSATPSRIMENYQVTGFTLYADEMQKLSSLGRADGRIVKPAVQPQWD